MINFEGDQIISSGKLVTGVQAKVMDIVTGECLGPNKSGFILVKSNYLMKGYIAPKSELVSYGKKQP
jgi:long-subunit acyl-CoA synthetase (AMP-forming)